jgi:hypothetical protein
MSPDETLGKLQALLRRWPAELYPTEPPYPPDFAEALDAQARRIGELERDARRYRWIRAQFNIGWQRQANAYYRWARGGAPLDAAIDTALSAERATEEGT